MIPKSMLELYQTDVRKLSLNVLVSSIENQSQSSISWLGDTLPVTVAAKLIMSELLRS